MKLYLSSYMLGDHADRLLEMAGGHGARMAVITNALDHIPLEAQLEYTRAKFDPISYFADHGFDASFVDLRFYFGRTGALRNALMRHRVIWALGGNAFLLRRAMHQSGFDQVIRDLLAEKVIYAGWSAGACVAGLSLQAIAIMDDPNVAAPGYGLGEMVWDGLGLVPFPIIPHYKSDHPEAESAARAVAWAIDRRIKHKVLRDGDVLMMDGSRCALLPRAD